MNSQSFASLIESLPHIRPSSYETYLHDRRAPTTATSSAATTGAAHAAASTSTTASAVTTSNQHWATIREEFVRVLGAARGAEACDKFKKDYETRLAGLSHEQRVALLAKL